MPRLEGSVISDVRICAADHEFRTRKSRSAISALIHGGNLDSASLSRLHAMQNPTSFALLALVLASVGSGSCRPHVETTEADLHPNLSDKTAVAHFKYKIRDKPVKITSVHPRADADAAL